MLSNEDAALIVMLGGSEPCSLNTSPGVNWVEKAGGLPTYICNIAKDIMAKGHSKGSAIAIAVGTVKRWARGGDKVTPATRAKAAKAVAQWEALKAKNKAGKVVKASREDGSEYLMLTEVGSFNTDWVRQAWNSKVQAERAQIRANYPNGYPSDVEIPYSYIRETWTDYIIVENDGGEKQGCLTKVPYTVDGTTVTWGEPVEVKVAYQEVADSDLDDADRDLLKDIHSITLGRLEKIVPLSRT